MRRSLVVLALAALVAGCSDQATSPGAAPPTPAADFTNNPDGGGPFMLYRGSEGVFGTGFISGHYVGAFFASALVRCGHAFPARDIAIQDHGDWESFYHWLVLAKSVNLYLVDLDGPPTCTVPLGSGRFVGWSEDAHIVVVENEQIAGGGSPDDPKYADSYGGSLTAFLTTPEGGRVHFTMSSRCVKTPSAPIDEPARCQGHLKVQE